MEEAGHAWKTGRSFKIVNFFKKFECIEYKVFEITTKMV